MAGSQADRIAAVEPILCSLLLRLVAVVQLPRVKTRVTTRVTTAVIKHVGLVIRKRWFAAPDGEGVVTTVVL